MTTVTPGQSPGEALGERPDVCQAVTAGAGKPALADRPLITPAQAGQMVGLFKVLANDSRLRLLHALKRAGRLCVGDLADTVGMRPQAVSNQPQRPTDRGIVAARREGKQRRLPHRRPVREQPARPRTVPDRRDQPMNEPMKQHIQVGAARVAHLDDGTGRSRAAHRRPTPVPDPPPGPHQRRGVRQLALPRRAAVHPGHPTTADARLVMWAWARPTLLRYAPRSGRAVHDPAVLTAELLRGYIAANLSDRHRRAKTRRLLAGQLDPANHRATTEAVAGLRAFDHPTLIVWGRDDPHFGPDWARRLHHDIPGALRVELLPDTGHLLMEEHPDDLARLVIDFLTDRQPARARPDTEVRHGLLRLRR
jgi:pimeloyl-ACP methyl ester carboxylesterase